jgi:hypothetical protein
MTFSKRYNRLAHETQRHRSHAEVARFFDGLELIEPGVVPVQEWRPTSEIEARIRSAMWEEQAASDKAANPDAFPGRATSFAGHQESSSQRSAGQRPCQPESGSTTSGR